MVQKQTSITLYNLIFPLWIAIFIPPFTLIPLLGNLLIDGGVIVLILKRNGVILERKQLWKMILKAWGFGFLADFIGVAMVMGLQSMFDSLGLDMSIIMGPTGFISVLILLIIVLFIGYLIFLFNRTLARKLGIAEPIAHRLGVWMGTITGPWLFLVPLSWYY